MTSSIFSPRRLLALCSPSTQVMASTTLLFPQPLGPTIAVTPVSKASSERSGKLLKPAISRRFKRILDTRPDLSGPDTPVHGSGWVRFDTQGFQEATGQTAVAAGNPTPRNHAGW